MKRKLLSILVVLVLLLSATSAEAGWGHHGHGYRSWGGVGINVGVGPAIYRPAYWGRPYFGYRPFYRPYVSYGYGGFYQPYFAYGYGYNPYCYPVQYAPAYYYGYSPAYYYYPTPAYYGYPAWYGSAPAVQINNVIVRRSEPAPRMVAEKVMVRSGVEDTSRARRDMKLGDASFAAGRYVDALTRYRTAAEAAPDLAEAHFRKGHAYLAHGNFDLAANSFRKALSLDPGARREGFNLEALYGKDSIAKGVHIENLAAAALVDESSANAYFLLGLMLHFNREEARAEKFFARAAALSPETRPAVAAFLPMPAEEPVSFALGDET